MHYQNSIPDRRASSDRVNLTSLMDVLTILLVFLLVNYSDSFEVVPGFISLPLAETSLESDAGTGPPVFVDAKTIRFEELVIPLESTFPAAVTRQLESRLRAARPESLVVIADKGLPYQTIDLVILAAAGAGIHRVRFVAQQGRS